MKMTTKSRYGVRLMVDLATFYSDKAVSLRTIATRQDISEKYLWQLVAPLVKAGFVNSVRGAKGGYLLNKSPREISLKDIITALEGPICLVKCSEDEYYCANKDKCSMYSVWGKLNMKILNLFDEINLQDIIDQSHSRRSVLNYEI